MLGHLYKCGVTKEGMQGKERSNQREEWDFVSEKVLKLLPV